MTSILLTQQRAMLCQHLHEEQGLITQGLQTCNGWKLYFLRKLQNNVAVHTFVTVFLR